MSDSLNESPRSELANAAAKKGRGERLRQLRYNAMMDSITTLKSDRASEPSCAE